jgi:hypothetical protein
VVSDAVLSFHATRTSSATAIEVLVVGRNSEEVVGVYVNGSKGEWTKEGGNTRVSVDGEVLEVNFEIHLQAREEEDRA